jgi:O-antigen/teichoic acid export membrane protein
MRKYVVFAKNLAFTDTAKDTYIIFSGNLLNAFLGFVYTLIAARVLTVADFGVFSAATNLIYIIVSLSDLGIAGAIVHFVAKLKAEGKEEEAKKYIKATLLIRVVSTLIISIPLLLSPVFFAEKFMATSQVSLSLWVFISSIGLIFYSYFPHVLQGWKKFFKAVVVENSYGVLRLGFSLIFLYLGVLNLSTLFLSFTLASIGPLILGLIFCGTGLLFVRADKKIYKSIFLFTSWLGVNKVISSVSGRLDVQMLAGLAGAVETGLYSIPSRLTLFVVIIASSFSAVLAPRFSSFSSKDKERAYIIKATLALTPIILGILFWIAIAEPFIVLLFGEKYITSVPIFRVLAVSTIPFLITAPAVSAIIYAMKKTVYIGAFAIPQLVIIFTLNSIFIPIYGAFGPAYTLIIVHLLLAVYVWVIVIRYYWIGKGNS